MVVGERRDSIESWLVKDVKSCDLANPIVEFHYYNMLVLYTQSPNYSGTEFSP